MRLFRRRPVAPKDEGEKSPLSKIQEYLIAGKEEKERANRQAFWEEKKTWLVWPVGVALLLPMWWAFGGRAALGMMFGLMIGALFGGH